MNDKPKPLRLGELEPEYKIKVDAIKRFRGIRNDTELFRQLIMEEARRLNLIVPVQADPVRVSP